MTRPSREQLNDAEWLRRQVDRAREQSWTQQQLANDLGISSGTLRRALKKAGAAWIPVRPGRIPRDVEWLTAQVERAREQNWTQQQLANDLRINQSTLARALPEAGVAWWSTARTAIRHDPEWLTAQVERAREQNWTQQQLANDLGISSGTLRRARKEAGVAWWRSRSEVRPSEVTRQWCVDHIEDGSTWAEMAASAKVTSYRMRTVLCRYGLTDAGRPVPKFARLGGDALQDWSSPRFPRWCDVAGLSLADVDAWHVAAFLWAEHLAGARLHSLAITLTTDVNAMTARQGRARVTRLVRPVMKLVGPEPAERRRRGTAFTAPLIVLDQLFTTDMVFGFRGNVTTIGAARWASLANLPSELPWRAEEICWEDIRIDEDVAMVRGVALPDKPIEGIGLSVADLIRVIAAGSPTAWGQGPWAWRKKPQTPDYETVRQLLYETALQQLLVTFAGRLAYMQAMRGFDPLRIDIAHLRAAADGYHAPFRSPTKTGSRWTRIDHTPGCRLCPACAAAAAIELIDDEIPGETTVGELLGSKAAYSGALRRRCKYLGLHPRSVTPGSMRRSAATVVYHRSTWHDVIVLLGHSLTSSNTICYVETSSSEDLTDSDFDVDAWQRRVRAEFTGTQTMRQRSGNGQNFSSVTPQTLARTLSEVRVELRDRDLIPGVSRSRHAQKVASRMQHICVQLDLDPLTPYAVKTWAISELTDNNRSPVEVDRDLSSLASLIATREVAQRWLSAARDIVAAAIREEKRAGVVHTVTQPPVATRGAFLRFADATDDPLTTFYLVAGFNGALRVASTTFLDAADLTFRPDAVDAVIRWGTKRTGAQKTYPVTMQHTGDALCPSRLEPLAKLASKGTGRMLWTGQQPPKSFSRTSQESAWAWASVCERVPDLAELQARSLRPSGAISFAELTRDLLRTMRHMGHLQPTTTIGYLTRLDPVMRSAGAVEMAERVSEMLLPRDVGLSWLMPEQADLAPMLTLPTNSWSSAAA